MVTPPHEMQVTEARRDNKWLSLYLPLSLFSVAHAIIFRFFFGIANDILFHQASAVFEGRLPYRDFLLEYPPLALVAVLPPRLFASDTWAYGRALSYEMLLFDIAIVALVALTARRMRLSAWQALLAYTAALAALGSIAAQRYDLWPALLVSAALYCFAMRRNTLCWLFLALGATAKLYPALLAPILALYHIKRDDHAGLARGLAVAAAVGAVVVLPWILLSPDGFRESIRYQLGRGLQMETTYASVLMIGENLGLTRLMVVFENGGDNIVSPLANRLADVASYVAPLALACVYLAYALHRRGQTERGAVDIIDTRTMSMYWALALLAVLMTAKVLSPQFLLWLMPLVALAATSLRWVAWTVLLLAAALSHYIFPGHYYDLMDFKTSAVAILAARNALLLGLTCLVFRLATRARYQA